MGKLEITVKNKAGKVIAKRGKRRTVTKDGATNEEINSKTNRWNRRKS